MKLTPDQIGSLRTRLLYRTRVTRLTAALEIADYGGEPWAQDLLCQGLFDSAPDVAEICAEKLSIVTPTDKSITNILGELDAGDRLTGEFAERIMRSWAAKRPGLIRVMAARGLNLRTQHVLLQVLAGRSAENRELTAAFTQIAPLISIEVLKVINGDKRSLQVFNYRSCGTLIELLARLFPMIRSNQALLETYVKTFEAAPIFWLGDELLDSLLLELKSLCQTQPVVHRLLQVTAAKALKTGNSGMLSKLVPILSGCSAYARKNALVLAYIASANHAGGDTMDKPANSAATRIRMYAQVLLDQYRPILAQEVPTESTRVVLTTVTKIGRQARPLIPEIARMLRNAQTDESKLEVIEAMVQIGFASDSEAVTALTLQSMSGSEEVRNAALDALKGHHKVTAVQPQQALAVRPAGQIPPSLSVLSVLLAGLPQVITSTYPRLLIRRVAAPFCS